MNGDIGVTSVFGSGTTFYYLGSASSYRRPSRESDCVAKSFESEVELYLCQSSSGGRY